MAPPPKEIKTMFNFIKNHKAWVVCVVFAVLAIVFNAPETENGLAMILFLISIGSGFIALVNDGEKEFKYGV